MTLLLVVVGIAVVAGVAVLVAMDRPVLADDPVTPTPQWTPGGVPTAEDLVGARFTVTLRGYRMDEVDVLLDDAAAALRAQQQRIEDLEAVVGALRAGPTQSRVVEMS